MKSTLNQIGDIIVRASETRAAMFKLKSAQKTVFLSADIMSIMAIAGITILLLSF